MQYYDWKQILVLQSMTQYEVTAMWMRHSQLLYKSSMFMDLSVKP